MEGCGPRGVRVSRHRVVDAITSVYNETCDTPGPGIDTFRAESLARDGDTRVVDTTPRHTDTT